jgi:predicted ATPase/class 3 adenylate cyclase
MQSARSTRDFAANGTAGRECAMTDREAARFGDVLRGARRAAGLTQAELADRAGLSVRGINDLERGARQHPHKSTIDLLADALGLAGPDRAAFASVARGHANVAAGPGGATGPDVTRAEPAAPDLPTGTVTFLFTDIEGSTRLLEGLGRERYAVLQSEHRRLLHTACAAHGGHVVDAQGDSCFMAFPTAPDALAAAAEAQHALAAHDWPDGAAVRVRMGLHTGTAQVAGDRYIGLDVHRAARIAAVGHGGQVLLSETSQALVAADLPGGVTLRELGAHRLKDLQRPERLVQLVVEGLPADFPPLQTLDRHAHNLPIQPTPLLGREREVAEVVALLGQADVRVVTLTGPGGVGKTRLALQVAAELVEAFADGVWFVRLSRLADPALVLPTIAQTLGLREAGSVPIAALLREYLQSRKMILVLDNFEQVVAAAPVVAELQAGCPGLRVLVTSRVTLHLQGEHEHPVSPLALPPAPSTGRSRGKGPSWNQVTASPAVALFVAQARTHRPDFVLTETSAPAVAAICARLDGLPLALGLAAARIKLLPPAQLLARLERRLPLLTGGARDLEARQQTLRNTLAWSEDLLQPAERLLFRRLAVFVGGFTLEAAEAVCAAPEGAEPLGLAVLDGLAALVDHSLVLQQPPSDEEGGTARFRLLYVVREYALERLETSGEAEALRRAHAACYVRWAEQAEPELRGLEGVVWLDRLEQEHDNFRAALAWAQAHPRTEAEVGLRLAAALEPFWFQRGHLSEGRSWTEWFLDAAAPNRIGALGVQEGVPATVWARALKAAGWLAHFGGGDYGPTAARLETAAAMARAAGDLHTVAAALNGLGAVAYFQGDLARAAMRLEESLALSRAAESGGEVAYILSHLGEVALHRGDLARASALSEEALTLARHTGELDAEVNTLCILGQLAQRGGDLPKALALHRQGLVLARTLRDPFRIANTLEYLVNVVGVAGQGEQAARLLGAAAVLRETIGAPRPSVEADLNEQTVAAARAALGEEAWAAAFAAGGALSLEEAIAEALGEWS